jgi:hypothetical protein
MSKEPKELEKEAKKERKQRIQNANRGNFE